MSLNVSEHVSSLYIMLLLVVVSFSFFWGHFLIFCSRRFYLWVTFFFSLSSYCIESFHELQCFLTCFYFVHFVVVFGLLSWHFVGEESFIYITASFFCCIENFHELTCFFAFSFDEL